MHELAQYVGRPWVLGEQGPAAFDCYGLVRYVYQRHLGIDLNPCEGLCSYNAVQRLAAGAAMVEDQQWLRLPAPAELCVVMMGTQKFWSHCGLWLEVDGGRVLHCQRRRGVIASRLAELPALGFSAVAYYGHRTRHLSQQPL